ncbi:hypothetical protein OAG48_00325 [bacterium]|nr:hypothetical protein [bacterium]
MKRLVLFATVLVSPFVHGQTPTDEEQRRVELWGDGQAAIAPPSFVNGLAVVTDIVINQASANGIAIRSDGRPVCWGQDPGNGNMLDVPGDVGSTSNPVVSVGQSTYRSFALDQAGVIRVWGNYGNDPAAERPSPREGDRWIEIFVCADHGIALSESGFAQGWGLDSFGQASGTWGTDLNRPVSFALSDKTSLALLQDGTIEQRGYVGGWSSPELNGRTVLQIAGTRYQGFAALLDDGSVTAWGPSGSLNAVPELISGPNDLVVDLAGGRECFGALLSDGRCVTWGPDSVDGIPSSLTPMAIERGVVLTVGYGAAGVLGVPVVGNENSGVLSESIEEAILAADSGDPLRAISRAFSASYVDFFGKTLSLKSTGALDLLGDSQWILNGGGRLESADGMTVAGELRVPANESLAVFPNVHGEAESGFEVLPGGRVSLETGASVQVSAVDSAKVEGSLVLGDTAGITMIGPGIEIGLDGEILSLGGFVSAESLEILGGGVTSPGRIVCIGGTVAVEVVQTRGGEIDLVGGTIVGDVEIDKSSTGEHGSLNATGYLFGDLSIAAGRCTTLNDLFVVGDLLNGVDGVVAVQAGTMYVSGGIANEGQIYGEVVGAPGFMGGGSTSQGDGLAIAGDLTLGPDASIRFSEPLWQISLGGDFDVAITSPSQFELIGSTLRLDGSSGETQQFEATSLDIGPDPLAFTDPPAGVSLIRELEIVSQTGVTVVDQHLNGGGKSNARESIYASRLEVAEGASLVLGEHILYCTEAEIDGTVDHPDQIVVVSILPDPDFNDDGLVNGADLAFILAFWGTNDPDVDLNGDGMVTAADLGILLGAWGVYP